MKKLLLLALVVCGGVMQASADDDPQTIYLRNNLSINNIDGWSGSNSVYKFTYQGKNPDNLSEDVYTYDIDASKFSSDIYFRLWVSGWDYEFAPNCRQHNDGFSFSFANGQNENYDVKVHWDEYKNQGKPSDWGSNSKDRTFAIPQSSIEAAKFKITLYCNGYNTSNDIAIKVEIVSMPAPIGSLGYATFSCNRALDLDNASEGLTAYKASENVVNGKRKVLLTKISGKVAPSTGLLLAGTSGTIPVVPTSEGTNISSSNALKASVTDTDITPGELTSDYYYFLAGTTPETLGFYSLTNGTTYTSAAKKAYLQTKSPLDNEGSGARVAWIFEDESTGISNTIREAATDNRYYNLSGQRVDQRKKGLYIVNGKKVIY